MVDLCFYFNDYNFLSLSLPACLPACTERPHFSSYMLSFCRKQSAFVVVFVYKMREYAWRSVKLEIYLENTLMRAVNGGKTPCRVQRDSLGSRTSCLRPPHTYSWAERPCVPLRDDATRQLRVPIAAAACQCDEDWHSGKLSLKIPLFPFPINQTIWAARKNAPGRGARTQPGLRRVFLEGKQKRQSSGKNKKKICIQGRGG